MMRFLILFGILFLFSCEDDRQSERQMIGNYEASIIGEIDYFDLSIDLVGDGILIVDAPFDNYVWSTVEVEFVESSFNNFALNIPFQSLGGDVFIWGSGFYDDHYLLLNYTMQFGPHLYDFSLEGFQY